MDEEDVVWSKIYGNLEKEFGKKQLQKKFTRKVVSMGQSAAFAKVCFSMNDRWLTWPTLLGEN